MFPRKKVNDSIASRHAALLGLSPRSKELLQIYGTLDSHEIVERLRKEEKADRKKAVECSLKLDQLETLFYTMTANMESRTEDGTPTPRSCVSELSELLNLQMNLRRQQQILSQRKASRRALLQEMEVRIADSILEEMDRKKQEARTEKMRALKERVETQHKEMSLRTARMKEKEEKRWKEYEEEKHRQRRAKSSCERTRTPSPPPNQSRAQTALPQTPPSPILKAPDFMSRTLPKQPTGSPQGFSRMLSSVPQITLASPIQTPHGSTQEKRDQSPPIHAATPNMTRDSPSKLSDTTSQIPVRRKLMRHGTDFMRARPRREVTSITELLHLPALDLKLGDGYKGPKDEVKRMS
eukprot:TRINITY_DN2410_c0_g1_i2.p1 TRINITY_DN2410_c0_g1~~TRINITY_DN2410_c0_g1_i2.p1  ORF type:complete len:353 (-),score=81.51 TRINITY_DN2410_c0_g1_i2:787-1845(-)